MAWFWGDVFHNPLWLVLTFYLGLRLQQRLLWKPKACTVQLNGKTAIVTGANTGIGKYIALDFARRGARVILACRNQLAGGAAVQEIIELTNNQDVHLRPLDTSSLSSVREFATMINNDEKALHILVNNAGVSGLPKEITEDGLEISFATNHLGPFLLTKLLLDLLKRSAPARIVNVCSSNHFKGIVNFSHFKGEDLTYKMDHIYNNTKLHQIICTNELARMLNGSGVTANSIHPGYVLTSVLRHYSAKVRIIFKLIGIFFFKNAKQGAASAIYCAVSEETEGITGKYFDSDCALVLPAPLARDPALGAKDYEISERLTSKL
ncbi:retinol dehydrogenase 12 isoform X1 [Gadus macrocephalus]|uniref:retinol dehydrogenase 12 isoform X1 n=1 Tax=Gadus macrocephalus TaxID=80720 RepID=UPI0028CB6DAD|nr:retinol dehydrogenase 12 isoform X1 [Gadus macrocephalus]